MPQDVDARVHIRSSSNSPHDDLHLLLRERHPFLVAHDPPTLDASRLPEGIRKPRGHQDEAHAPAISGRACLHEPASLCRDPLCAFERYTALEVAEHHPSIEGRMRDYRVHRGVVLLVANRPRESVTKYAGVTHAVPKHHNRRDSGWRCATSPRRGSGAN